MAGRNNKSLVKKDDLKRLMKQSASQITNRKIDSPLAKYDSLDNLHCALCSTKVKNNLHWKAHVQGRTHKENVAAFKLAAEKKHEATVAPPSDLKRKQSSTSSTEASESSNKKSKIPGDFFDSSSKQQNNSNSKSNSLRLGNYSSSDDDIDDATTSSHVTPSSGHVTPTSGSDLPADFFDDGIKPSGKAKEDEPEEEETVQSMAEKIPEGFFDNPKLDAKAREVKYIDKEEEEWQLFQKAIKEQNIVSEQLQADDDEEKQAERNVKEIDEHMYHWSKVEQLHEQKEKFMETGKKSPQNENSSNSDVDEQEYAEFLDWRTKKV